MRLNTKDIEGKFYISGFPKAGLHLLDLMLRPMAMPMGFDPLWRTPWAGMYEGNSFTLERIRPELTTLKMSRVQPGFFLKGHLGCDPDIERFMYLMGFTHYFIYRDLRDVAVSQAHHIMVEDEEDFPHSGKAEMRPHGFDWVLRKVIEGYEEYVGIFDRWELYAPWLDVDWTFNMSFEEVVADRLNAAMAMIDHFFERMSFILDVPEDKNLVEYDQKFMVAEEMVKLSKRTKISLTFRKGITGEWKNEFKDEHKQLFKDLDVNNWLVRLGYEKDKDW
jgi:hypothetical protein